MKKVLIITYHWPPSGGIAVLRCLKLTKYLRENGWEPIIFTAKDASYQYLDYTNEKDVPENIEIHKVPIFEPIDLFKKLTGRKKDLPVQNITSNSEKKKSVLDKISMWVRGNFFIPDARCKWIKPSVKYLNKYLKTNSIDAIFTDGPTHTNTVIGMRVAQKHGIPWLADFQDPWTQVDYYEKLYIGKRADRIHKALEQEVFASSSKITIASPTWKKDLESIGAKNVDVFYYGFDEDDFEGYSNKPNKKFVIFHGGLLGEDRNPEILFQTIKKIITDLPQLKTTLQLRLAGEVDFTVRKSIEEYGLNDIVEYLGMIPRKNVLHEFETASLLLLPINKAANASGRIPGKLFEMLRSGKPILVFGPEGSDVQEIVESKKLGRSFEYSNFDDVEAYLNELLLKDIDEMKSERIDVSEFSNQFLTKQIAVYLDHIVNQKD